MILVITGGTGFVGAALIRSCIKDFEGDLEVRALVRTKGRLPRHPKIMEFEGDLARLNGDLFPDRPHVLIHLASKNLDPDGTGYQATNVNGTENLLRACTPLTKGVIYNSSLSVLGQGAQVNCPNQVATNPETDLALSRAQAEERVFRHGRMAGSHAYCLRPRFVLGEGDQFVMPALAKLVHKGIFVGDGQQQYSVIDASDYAKVILNLAERCMKNKQPECMPLNIGYSRPVRYEDIYLALRKSMGSVSRKKILPKPALMASLLKRFPIRSLRAKATQLQLIGLDHYSDTAATQKRLSTDLLSRDSLEYVSTLSQQYGSTV